MATITVKNIPDKTYKTLKQLAAEHHRSINSEIIHLIEQVTRSTKIDPNEHVVTAKKIRKKTQNHLFTEQEINYAKNEGRA